MDGASAAEPVSLEVGGANPYRELCVLASDLGQPQLIYHFLVSAPSPTSTPQPPPTPDPNLATPTLHSPQALPTTHTAWSGRRGAGYASSGSISASDLRSSLEPLFPKLIPRLFRARFYPSSAVRQVGLGLGIIR